jgi:uncharacterized Zn finger protein (UPF0148 family)
MFYEVLRKLSRMEQGERVSLSMGLDDDGYFDRVCPSPPCASEFKVLFQDWREKVPDDYVHCPICGFVAPSTDWNTPEQAEHIKASALHHIQKQLGDALVTDARRFNQSQRPGGLIKMSMSYCPSQLPILIPARASAVMRQQSTCEVCGCRYSSVGAAFFCPACGHNSTISTFDASVETVRKTMEALPEIQRVLTESTDRDAAQDSVRQICENGLVKLVSAFQRLAEALYGAVPSETKPTPRRNVFQNIRESSELWRAAIGAGYDQMVAQSELRDLERFFQQRHLLAHNDAIVDQTYLDRSGDTEYGLGQRLVIRQGAVEQLAVLVSTLAIELRSRASDA